MDLSVLADLMMKGFSWLWTNSFKKLACFNMVACTLAFTRYELLCFRVVSIYKLYIIQGIDLLVVGNKVLYFKFIIFFNLFYFNFLNLFLTFFYFHFIKKFKHTK